MKKIYIAANIIAASVLLILLYYAFIKRPVEDINISCHGTLISGNQHTASRMRVSVFLNGKNGRINFDGIVKSDNKQIAIIRRATSFSLSHLENGFIINQSIVSELPGNTASTEVLTSMFPSFMLFNNEDYRFNIYPVGLSSYLFMSDNFVTLYCAN